MPTTRHRYQVTETDDVADALKRAAERWPEEAEHPGQLLKLMIGLASARIAEENEAARKRRQHVIELNAGRFTGLYTPGYIEKLHSEWPD